MEHLGSVEEKSDDKSYYPEWLKCDLSRYFNKAKDSKSQKNDDIADDLVKDKGAARLRKNKDRDFGLDK